MKTLLGSIFAVTTAIFIFSASPPASACNGGGNCDNAPGHLRGVPGPIVGAGLPFLAIGYGVYWLVKRRRTDV